MSVRARRAGADDQRERVMEAAMLEIVERGLDAVSMRDIARRAGMSPGHILYYFGSKDVLLLEVLRWSEADLSRSRRVALASTRGRDGAIRRFCELYLPADQHDPRWHLWIQLQARPPRDEASLDVLLDLLQGWIVDLTAIVGERSLAERACSLMDGLAMEMLLGLPGRTRARALRISQDAIRRELEGSGDERTTRRAG